MKITQTFLSLIFILITTQSIAQVNEQTNVENDSLEIDALTILSNGNIGIGTTKPDEKLDVDGNIRVKGDVFINGSMLRIKGKDDNATQQLKLHHSGGSAYIDWRIGNLNFRYGTTIRMNITREGNVGIGTTSSPKKPLDIGKKGGIRINRTESSSSDNEIFFADNGQIRSRDNNHRLLFNRSSDVMEMREYGDIIFSPGAISGTKTQKITFKANGNVGIGVATPTQAKLVVYGGGKGQRFTYSFLNRGEPTGKDYTPPNNVSYSIYSNGRIAASEFNAFSDARIKNSIGVSNAAKDLETLSKIEITNYTLIDTISKGNQTHKKVIAQQVKEVYPQAVSSDLTDVIPNIYALSTIKDGWIHTSTKDLAVGDKIQLIFSEDETLVDVLEIQGGAIKVASDQEGPVFVYGKQVSDFHTVDYEAIAMLNVSATQELLKRIDTLSRKQKQLENQLSASVSRIEKLETLFNNLK